MPRGDKPTRAEAKRARERAEQEAEDGYEEDEQSRRSRTDMKPSLRGLPDKKATVQCMIGQALDDLAIKGKTAGVEIALSREGVVYTGGFEPRSNLFKGDLSPFFGAPATTNDWNRVLSEGIGAKLKVDWYRTVAYPWGDLRVLRLGEPIFDVMRSRGLNPEWDGTSAGEFTITAVDEAGVKLALAMALHPRLGSESPLSLMEPGLMRLIADLSVDFSGGQDGGGRARWGWPSPGGTSDEEIERNQYYDGYYDDSSDFGDYGHFDFSDSDGDRSPLWGHTWGHSPV